jgi:hypothetical protein
MQRYVGFLERFEVPLLARRRHMAGGDRAAC